MSTTSERLLRQPAVLAQTALKRSALYDKIKRGEFPRPVSIGKRAVAWPESAVLAWINERVADVGVSPASGRGESTSAITQSCGAVK